MARSGALQGWHRRWRMLTGVIVAGLMLGSDEVAGQTSGDVGPPVVIESAPSQPAMPGINPPGLVETPRPTPERPLALRSSVLKAIARGVDLSTERADLESALAAVAIERARRFPEIAAVGVGGVDRADGGSGLDGRAEAGLRLSATVFDFGASEARQDAARAGVDVQRHQLSRAYDALALTTGEAFLEVLLRRQLVQVQSWAFERAVTLQNDTRRGVEERSLDELAIENAEVFRTQRALLLELAQQDREAAEARLGVLLGFETPDVALVDPVLDLPATGGVSAAISRAIARSPDIAAARASMEQAQADYRETRSTAKGSVRFEADAAVGRNVSGESDTSFDSSALVRVVIPLFDGGVSAGELSQRRLTVARAGTEIERRERAVEQEVRQAFVVSQHVLQTRTAHEETLRILQRQLESLPADIEAQLRSFDDVPGLVAQYSEATTALVTAYYLQQFAALRFAATTGELRILLDLERDHADWLAVSPPSFSPFSHWVDAVQGMF